MEISPLFVVDIRVPDDHREPNADTVNGLVKSFKEIGQRSPITIYEDDDGPVLIAGRNRLEAARRLDWEKIEAIEMDVDQMTREIWRIDENLMRAELTEIERGDHLKRRKEIFDAKGGEKISTPGGEQKVGFDKDIADKIGMSKSAVQKSRSRAEKIIPEVKEQIKDMPAAKKGVELDALASMKAHEQVGAVHKVKTGISKDFREAKAQIKGQTQIGKIDTIEVEFGHLKRVWHRAGITARKKFRVWLKDQPEGRG